MRHLLLFGKRPRRGRVKTRLTPPLSPEQALRLYRAFLADQLRFVSRFASHARVSWWTDGRLDPRLDGDLPLFELEVRGQGPGDLGSRLKRAFNAVERAGATASVVIGADSPTLPAPWIAEAFERLERDASAVLAPAEDGGYVLIGTRGSADALFDDVPWGRAGVAAATRRHAAEAGIALAELAPWYDVDDAVGLRRLAAELAHPAMAGRAPATWRCLLDLAVVPVV